MSRVYLNINIGDELKRIHIQVPLGFIVEPIDGSFQVVRIGGQRLIQRCQL